MTKEREITDTIAVSKKKIGTTTYIVSTRFNGDKQRDMVTSLIRLIGRDTAFTMPKPISKMGA